MIRIRGSYALAIMFKDYPGEIYVARKDSPMVLGIENGESYIASDVPAILKYTRNIYYIGNLEMARVRKGEITFFDLNGDEIEKTPKTIDWDAEAAEKAGYEHFMMKEIHEQPRAITDTLNSVIKEEVIDLSDIGLTEEAIKGVGRITSSHVDLPIMWAWQLSMCWRIWPEFRCASSWHLNFGIAAFCLSRTAS